MGDYNWGGGAKGAAGGAMIGTAIAPGLGTAIGGGIGFLGGLFGGGDDEQMKQMLAEYYKQAMKPPTEASYSDFRGNQRDLVGRLEAMSKGQGPSLAAQQFQAATDRNVASQQSMANSGRGGPMAQLTAANNTGMLGAQQAQGSAMARTNEQMGALSQLGGVINQGRNSDENVNLANLQARGMSRQQALQALQMMNGVNQQPGFGDQLLAGGAGAMAMGFGKGGTAKLASGAPPSGGRGQGSGMQLADPWNTQSWGGTADWSDINHG